MGRLKHLIVENFKSYEGKHLVGPFDDFSCIIGPNGSGKSNMMDAISFVLGVHSKQLRSSHLKELIFKKDDVRNPVKKAVVELVYELSADERIELLDENGIITFTRLITSSGVSTYKLNKKEVSYEDYENVLNQLGVLIKARNFLVFQGDVESVASKSPQDLTKFLEQISGSLTYKNEYLELTKQKEAIDESILFMIQKKKMYSTQFKEVKQQKDEADTYQELKNELATKKSNHILYQIWNIKRDITNHQDIMTNYNNDLIDIKDNESNIDIKINNEKKELAKFSKSYSTIEKDLISKTNAVNNNLLPKLNKLKSKLKNLNKQRNEYILNQSNVMNDQTQQQTNINKLQSELNVLLEKESILQNELSTLEQSDIYMNPETIKEYSNLRELVSSRISNVKSDELLVEQDVNSKLSHIIRLENQIINLSNDIESTNTSVNDVKNRISKLDEVIRSNTKDTDNFTFHRNELLNQLKQNEKDSLILSGELNDIISQLRDIGDDKRRSNHEIKLNEAIDTMKRIFTGVHGRVIDLINPIQKKYNIAVTVAVGKHMDAIVVDTKQIAYECIKYLKDQRIGICTFLPLNNIITTTIPDRLRNLGSKYKPCVDLIDCLDIYKPVVNYAIGSTIVADTLDDAQELCFQRFEKVKVVTMIGSVISKTGAMTGGTVMNKSSNRFDEKEIENLYRRQKEIENKLLLISNNNIIKQNILDFDVQIKSLSTKINFSKSDIELHQEKLNNLLNQIKNKEILLNNVKNDLTIVVNEKDNLANRLNILKNEIIQVENEIFSNFSKKLGIDNIRIYEENKLNSFNNKINEIKMITEQKALIQSHLLYENKKQYDIVLTQLSIQINDNLNQINECSDDINNITTEQSSINTIISDNKLKLTDINKLKSNTNNNIKLYQVNRMEIIKQKELLNKKISNEDILIEKLRSSLHEILQKAQVEEISLPTIEVEDSIGSESSNNNTFDSDLIWTGSQKISSDIRTTTSGRRNVRKRQSSEVESSATESTHFSMSQNQTVLRDQAKVATVDLSSMNKYKNYSKQQLQEFENSLLQQINQTSTEIESMQPNMHASERFDVINDKLKECNDELDETKEKSKFISNRFDEIKSSRQQLFVECYRHVSESLSVIYKDLTRSSKHPLGGNAYLTLDNTDEPYNGGIRFTAMPPMKRFRDMDQLSGGEKTIAALALLFSIHSYRQAPFFVLDEVDAALDNVNVRKVCNYVKQRSKDFQCIVISLKDLFYENADCLIGICKDNRSQSSKIFTLDLKKYDDSYGSSIVTPSKQSNSKGGFRLIEELDIVTSGSQSFSQSQGTPRSLGSVATPTHSDISSAGRKRAAPDATSVDKASQIIRARSIAEVDDEVEEE